MHWKIRDYGSSTSLFFMNGSNLGRFYDNSCDVSGHDTIDISNANSVSLLYSLLLFMFLYLQWKFILTYDSTISVELWYFFLKYFQNYLYRACKYLFILYSYWTLNVSRPKIIIALEYTYKWMRFNHA